MSIPKIDELDVDDLETVRKDVEKRIAEINAQRALELRQRFEAEAAAAGISFRDVVRAGKPPRQRRARNGHEEVVP